MTRVPLAPEVVEGMINLRGQIVVAIDLRRRLALSERAEGELPINVVVRTPDGAVSLLVDEIGDVIEVENPWEHEFWRRMKPAAWCGACPALSPEAAWQIRFCHWIKLARKSFGQRPCKSGREHKLEVCLRVSLQNQFLVRLLR